MKLRRFHGYISARLYFALISWYIFYKVDVYNGHAVSCHGIEWNSSISVIDIRCCRVFSIGEIEKKFQIVYSINVIISIVFRSRSESYNASRIIWTDRILIHRTLMIYFTRKAHARHANSIWSNPLNIDSSIDES